MSFSEYQYRSNCAWVTPTCCGRQNKRSYQNVDKQIKMYLVKYVGAVSIKASADFRHAVTRMGFGVPHLVVRTLAKMIDGSFNVSPASIQVVMRVL